MILRTRVEREDLVKFIDNLEPCEDLVVVTSGELVFGGEEE